MEHERYSGDEFNEFIKELIENQRLSDAKEEGIARQVIDKGFESLTEKQVYVFEKAISHYIYDDCMRCGNEIPWCEMSGAEDNGGQCSWCQQLGRNDKD